VKPAKSKLLQPAVEKQPKSSEDEEILRKRREVVFDLLDGDRDGVLTEEELVPDISVHSVIGAKGSRLQLILSTLYPLSRPVENVPYSLYRDFMKYEDEKGNIIEGAYSDYVSIAVPYCLGDWYGR